MAVIPMNVLYESAQLKPTSVTQKAVAGIAGLMKTALCLHQRTLVPNLHFNQPNPYIDFEGLHLRVQTELENWPWYEEVPRAGVSSFGFGGTNCHLVLETVSSNASILPISAHSPKKLRQKLVSAMGLFSGTIGGSQAAALSLELAARDGGSSHRAALAVGDARGFFEALSARLRAPTIGKPRDQRPRLIFVCPGHGTQWLGMARSLLSSEPEFRQKINACDRLIQSQCGWSLIDELLTDAKRSRLQQHDVAQLTIFSISVALGELWSRGRSSLMHM